MASNLTTPLDSRTINELYDHAPGRAVYQRRGRKAHWIPPGSRQSPCGQLDLDFHKTKRVPTIKGFLPHNFCGLCEVAIGRIEVT